MQFYNCLMKVISKSLGVYNQWLNKVAFMKVFSEKLRKVLRDQGFSQSEFARLTGVTSQCVNGWCMSRSLPRQDVLQKISDITGKPLFWFFMTSEEEKKIFHREFE